MLTEEQVAFFHANGYVTTGEPLLSAAEVQTLRDALDQVIAGTSPDRPHLLRNMAGGGLDSDKVVVQIVNIWQAHPAYREHIARPDIVEMALAAVADGHVAGVARPNPVQATQRRHLHELAPGLSRVAGAHPRRSGHCLGGARRRDHGQRLSALRPRLAPLGRQAYRLRH